jgi:hypothetical protein
MGQSLSGSTFQNALNTPTSSGTESVNIVAADLGWCASTGERKLTPGRVGPVESSLRTGYHKSWPFPPQH